VLGTGELNDVEIGEFDVMIGELGNEELLVADEDDEVLDMRAEASHTVGFTTGLPAAYFGKHGPWPGGWLGSDCGPGIHEVSMQLKN
jgi:hypothetical protein